MEGFYLDHYNIEALKHLFKNFSRDALTTMKTLTINKEEIIKFPPLGTLQIFRSLEELIITNCKITDFPTEVITASMPQLKKIDLRSNNFATVKVLLPLGELSKLEELHLEGNPLTLLSHRISLLQALLFPKNKIRYKLSACYTASYKAIKQPKQQIIVRDSRSVTSIILNSSKPAKVPRKGMFPMLRFLNHEVITEDEVNSARPFIDETWLAAEENQANNFDPILEKVKKKNAKILALRERYGADILRQGLHPCDSKKPRVEHVSRTVRLQDMLIRSSREPSIVDAEPESSVNTSVNVSRQEEKLPDSPNKVFTEEKFLGSKASNTHMSETPGIESSPLLSKSVKKIPLTPIPPLPDPPKPPVSPLIEFKKRKNMQRENLWNLLDSDRNKSPFSATRRSSLIQLIQEANIEEPEIVVEEKKNEEVLKEKMKSIIEESKRIREKAIEPFLKKIYNFNEVNQFVNKIDPYIKNKVQTVSDVLNLVNDTKGKTHGITDMEVRQLLQENMKELPLDEIELLHKIVALDDDIKNMRLKNTYLDWWLGKMEKKRLQIAEHQAILALHKKRIFGNPTLAVKSPKPWQDEYAPPKNSLVSRAVSQGYKIKLPENKQIATVHRMAEQEFKKKGKEVIEKDEHFSSIDFKSLFKDPNVKEGPVIYIKPILKLETMLEHLHTQLREKEKEFEELSYDDKVMLRLQRIKKNIAEREIMRDRLKSLYSQVEKMKLEFQENEKEYFYNMYEKKEDIHELLSKEDFSKVELPRFIIPQEN